MPSHGMCLRRLLDGGGVTSRLERMGPDLYRIVVELGPDPRTGRRRRRTKMFHGGKRAAEKERAEFEALQQGTGAKIAFGRLLDEWLEFAADAGGEGEGLAPTTLREYRRLVEKRIKPELGHIVLEKLTARDLDLFYRRAGVDVRQIHAVIRRALQQAWKWKFVAENEAKRATPPTRKSKDAGAPTIAVVRLLVLEAERRDPDYGMAVRLAAATGERRGELCALRWTDIDLDAGLIRVARSYYRVGDLAGEKDTKTHAERTIAIDEGTVTALMRRWGFQQARAWHAHVDMDRTAFVLSTYPSGTEPMIPARLTDFWRRLRKKVAPDSGWRLHDLRHWSVTEALDAGYNVLDVAARHGHASAKMTLDVYGHSRQERQAEIAASVGKALNP